MNPGQSKWLIALKSAVRALSAVLSAIVYISETGGIHTWHDLTNPNVIHGILIGLGIKYIQTGTTAKDVTVKTG